MTGIVVTSNRLPTPRAKSLRTIGASDLGGPSSRWVKADAKLVSKIDIARCSDRTVDQAGLETIGLLLVLVTLLVIFAGAFAMRRQLAADLPLDETTYGVRHRQHIGFARRPHAGPTAGNACVLIPPIKPHNCLL